MTHKILDKYNELKRERPNLDHDLVMTFIEDMSDEASMLFDKLLFGCHIYNEEMGKKAIASMNSLPPWESARKALPGIGELLYGEFHKNIG